MIATIHQGEGGASRYVDNAARLETIGHQPRGVIHVVRNPTTIANVASADNHASTTWHDAYAV